MSPSTVMLKSAAYNAKAAMKVMLPHQDGQASKPLSNGTPSASSCMLPLVVAVNS